MDAATEATATFQLDQDNRPVSLTWMQSGVTSTYIKQNVPPRLNVQAEAGRILLTVTGVTGVDYVVESSEDLTSWAPIATTTIWDDPVVVSPEPGDAQGFFRAGVPD